MILPDALVLEFALICLVFLVFGLTIAGWSFSLGPGIFCVAVVLLIDVGARAVLEQTSLYVNATYAQPALRVQGALVGIATFTLAGAALAARATSRRRPRLHGLDWLVALLVPLAILGTVNGLVRGNTPIFVIGDAYKVLLIPAVYALVRIGCRRREQSEQLFWVATAIALLVAGIQLVKVSARIGTGESLTGVGAPPLIALAAALAVLALRRRPRRDVTLAAAIALFVLLLYTVSLQRGLWLASIAMTLVAVAVAPRRMLTRAIVPAMAGLALIGLAVKAAAPSVAAQVEQRMHILDTPPASATLMPPKDPVDSLEERRWEVIDSSIELARGGPLAIAFGHGAGAEYPTALPRTENTSAEGHRHQIHVTWVSVLFRHGLVGLAILLSILVAVGLAIRRGGRDVVPLALALWLLGGVLVLTNAYGFFGEVSWGVLLGLAVGIGRHAAS